jgi:hypothetical protein
MESDVRFWTVIQTGRVCLSCVPIGRPSALNAKLPCHVVVFIRLSARACHSGSGSNYIYELVQPPIILIYNWNYLLFKFVIFWKFIFSKMKKKNNVNIVKILFTPKWAIVIIKQQKRKKKSVSYYRCASVLLRSFIKELECQLQNTICTMPW